MTEWIEGIVIENQAFTDNLFSLKVRADVHPFTAGQFTSLALDFDEERIVRPYSYLNTPSDELLEFFVSTVPDGKLSNLLKKLNSKDNVWVRQKSNGFFTLDEVPIAEDLWMLATGTGLAPFLSILNCQQVWETYQHIVLVYAVRKADDIGYQMEIEKLQNKHGTQLSTAIFVSRETVQGTLGGRIPQAIAEGILETHVMRQLMPEKSQVMLVGNPGMVKDTTSLLLDQGFTKNLRRKPGQITFENYW